jgi:hypothetical protein
VSYRAISGNNEFRVFCDPALSGSQNRPWIRVIREIGEDGMHTHVFHEPYSTASPAAKSSKSTNSSQPNSLNTATQSSVDLAQKGSTAPW